MENRRKQSEINRRQIDLILKGVREMEIKIKIIEYALFGIFIFFSISFILMFK